MAIYTFKIGKHFYDLQLFWFARKKSKVYRHSQTVFHYTVVPFIFVLKV